MSWMSSECQHLHAVGKGFHPSNAAQQPDHPRRRPFVFVGIEQVYIYIRHVYLGYEREWVGPREKRKERKGGRPQGKTDMTQSRITWGVFF
jgi:hypothetical protein